MRKKKLTERFTVKVFAYFVTVLSFCAALVMAVGSICLGEWGFYQNTLEELKIQMVSQAVMEKSKVILNHLFDNEVENAYQLCEDTNMTFQVVTQKGQLECGNYDGNETKYLFEISKATDLAMDNKLKVTAADTIKIPESQREQRFLCQQGIEYLGNERLLYIYINDQFPYQDDLSLSVQKLSVLYTVRFYLPVIALFCVILCFASFIFQMCSAGRKYGQEQVAVAGVAKIPMDILICGLLLSYYFLLKIGTKLLWGNIRTGDLVLLAVIVLTACILGIAFCLIGAIQIKADIWWKNSVICRILHYIITFVRFMIRCLVILCRSLPDLLQIGIGIAGILLLETIMIVLWGTDASDILFLWILEKLFLILLIIYVALVFLRLLRASEALAKGDLTYQVDTKYMAACFKEQGENLNSIAEGMNVAVEERLKSERLKTELITNVSHDIKTPLTSIINYADLIGEEPTQNPRITEYAQVLKRHSVRLKKLIEDLMEASKASTGNVEVNLMACEVGVLLTQAAGEYEQRLEEQGLKLITKHPDKPVRILADGKLLWRIFDNLMNNICKYALKGTRVYLTVEEIQDKVRISFKNISRCQLEVSAEELMERFVRGDRSRHTEGNGLGLSIAQSLTQLQGGNLQLIVDGDFFKVVLIFDILQMENKSNNEAV